MSGIVIRDARVVTMTDAGTLDGATVVIEGDRIAEIRPGGGTEDPPASGAHAGALPTGTAGPEVIDAQGRVLLPGFVDAHTHALWAGDRLEEHEARRAGASYLDILAAGGGIMSTVRAVRAASREELADLLLGRLRRMLELGSTTIEVKSGYGLDAEHELKSLRAIEDAASRFEGTVVPTALLGHAVDADVPGFFRQTIDETLPAVSDEFPGITVDAYCEEGAWPLEECLRLFERATELGHPCRVHADQFNALGMTEAAIERGFTSVDHLEATGGDVLGQLAGSRAYAVMLPGCGFHLDNRYADARAFLDAPGGAGRLVIATNYNPGSSPTPSIPMTVGLAVRRLGMTTDEAIRATTVTPSKLLGFEDRGTLEPGARADCLLLGYHDLRILSHEFGGNPVAEVICGGRRIGG